MVKRIFLIGCNAVPYSSFLFVLRWFEWHECGAKTILVKQRSNANLEKYNHLNPWGLSKLRVVTEDEPTAKQQESVRCPFIVFDVLSSLFSVLFKCDV